MKHGQISRQQLLQSAKALVIEEGADALNIRRLAAVCGVSVGSIWREAIHGVPWPTEAIRFEEFVAMLYARLYAHFQTFEQDWLVQLSAMDRQERARSKQTEAQYFAHMRQGMLAVLAADETIAPGVWDDVLTPEALVELVFEQLLAGLRREKPDINVLLAILQRLLHP